jgi:Arylesterase
MRDPSPRGDIWIYDYASTGDVHRVPLDGYPLHADFHPLGVDVVPPTAYELATLFVINHARDNTTIEVFHLTDTAPYRATYVRTLTHRAFVSLNALVALSPTTLYVTNDHALTRRLPKPLGDILPLLETFLRIPSTWVDRVDLVGSDIRITRVANLAFANGIALSPNKKEIVVASSTACNVRLYTRDEKTNDLTYRSTVPLPFAPDNVSYDEEDGSIIVAGHPHFYSLIKVAAKQSDTAPSWVTEISATRASTNDSAAPYPAVSRAPVVASHAVNTLYQSDGSHYSSSSTGAKAGKDLFVTGLYADGILHCK